jgi:filamentous hemagglutinin
MSVFVGEAGSQGGFYVGGTQQVVVVKPWNIRGVQVIGSVPLK